MLRVATVSLWRTRGLTTWVLPRTFSTPAGSDSTNYKEERLQKIIESGSITEALQFAEHCKTDGVPLSSTSYASLLHMFFHHGEHCAVDELYTNMQKNSNCNGEGIRTTMIKSYCDRGLFNKAIQLLRSIINDNIVHHTRHYNYIIKSLAESGHVELALQLFEEKCEKQAGCWTSKSDKSFKADKAMLASLLNPKQTQFAVQVTEDSQQTNFESSLVPNTKLDSPKNALGDHRDIHPNSKRPEGSVIYLYTRMSHAVFNHLQYSAVRLPISLLLVIQSWFKHDPVHFWSWRTSKVNETGMCSNCGNQLTYGIRPSNISELESEVIKLINDVQKNSPRYHGNHLNKKMLSELEGFLKFVKEKGPFDVVIDGLNVGLHGSSNHEKVFSTEMLRKVAKNCFFKGKKVLLIIRHKALIQNAAEDLATSLEDVCSVFANKFQLDDLYLLYAAAFSGMHHIEVVTNDRLRDHRLLLPTSIWWTFLRWTRLNCVSFRVNGNGKVVFFKQKFDPVVQRVGNSWHFPATDNTWRCVTKQSD